MTASVSPSGPASVSPPEVPSGRPSGSASMPRSGARPGPVPARTGERASVRVEVTPRASRRIRSLLAAHPGEAYGLRVAVGGGPADPTPYLLSLAPQPHPGDLVLPRNGFAVFVPGGHAERLEGVRIDFVESPTSAGFLVEPPVRRSRPRTPDRTGGGLGTPAAGTGGVPGDPEVVAAVLAAIEQVRPALLADGGDIDLVAVTGRTAEVALSGACSGCSSAALTLADLVQAVVVRAVPAIERVVLVA